MSSALHEKRLCYSICIIMLTYWDWEGDADRGSLQGVGGCLKAGHLAQNEQGAKLKGT